MILSIVILTETEFSWNPHTIRFVYLHFHLIAFFTSRKRNEIAENV